MPQGDAHPDLNETFSKRQEVALGGTLIEFPRENRVTVVDFWATSCEPCKRLMVDLEGLYSEYREYGLEVIGVARDDNPGLVQKFKQNLQVTYPTVLDNSMIIQADYLVDASLPWAFVFDRERRLRYVRVGAGQTASDELKQAVLALLYEGK